MIPKVIHYCWFGGNPLSELAQKCLRSWEKNCPDYEIQRWDESNFDINFNDYVHEAYEAKKWAFVTDVVRLYVLVNYGGIYMDTDVEVLKPLDIFLQYEAFSGFESETQIPTGIMASEQGYELFSELLNEYNGIHFFCQDGSINNVTNVIRITNACLKYGFIPNNRKQCIKGFTLFPKEYFCPKDYQTRITTITSNTYTIHHFDGSWINEIDRFAIKNYERIYRFFPQRFARHIAKFAAIYKLNGLSKAIHETFGFWKRN